FPLTGISVMLLKKSVVLFVLRFEAKSSTSLPVIADKSMALSITLFVIGPGVSRVLEIGIIPPLLKTPTVGFSPTSEFWLDGDKIDPDVSDPTAAVAKLAATATALPLLEPPVSRIFLP